MAITNLTNTIWVFNNTLTRPTGEGAVVFSINFTCTANDFDTLGFPPSSFSNTMYYTGSSASTISVYSFTGSWENQAFRIIEITGGTDVTNASLIAWLEANATQVPVVDLSDTEWVIISYVDTRSVSAKSFNINFTTTNTNFTSIIFGNTSSIYTTDIFYDNTEVWNYDEDWDYLFTNSYRLISITGGQDVSNPDLLVWLNNNATQVYLSDLTNTIWNITSTSMANWQNPGVLSTNFTVSGNLIDYNNNEYTFDKIDISTQYNPHIRFKSGNTQVYEILNNGQILNLPITISLSSPGTEADNMEGYSPDLIAWLSQNATYQEPIPTKTFDLSTLQLSAGTHEIKVKARASGFRDSEFSNSVSYVVSPSQVTDLTGTTWRLPSGMIDMDILVHGTDYYDRHTDINFTSNGQSFIGMSSPDTAENGLYYDASNSANSVYVQPAGVWNVSDAYKTIHITGGTDATNQDLIDWLYDNATLLTNGKEVTFTASDSWNRPSYGEVYIYDGQDDTGILLLEQSPANKSAFPMTLTFSSGYCYIKIGGGWYGWAVSSSDFSVGQLTEVNGYGVSLTQIDKNGTININIESFD